MNKGMSIEAALAELQKPLNGPNAKAWAFGPAVRTLIAALEQAQQRIGNPDKWTRDLEESLIFATDRNAMLESRIDELENDEVRQRLANAEHQLHMAELAKHNLKASRRAQFRKRLAAERRIAELEASKLSVKLPEKHCMLFRDDFDEDYQSQMAYKSREVDEALISAGIALDTGE